MVRELTSRQQEVLNFIREYLDRHEYPPTLHEIATHFGMASANAARDHVRALEVKGFLRREADRSRALAVTGKGKRRGFPLVGEIAAGSPVLAEENFQEHVDLGNYFGADPAIFILRVKGESMTGVGIRDGDLVVVRHQPTIGSGEIGVAYLGQEATVKRIFFEAGDTVRLQPENPTMAPIRVRRNDPDFRVGGKVIGVVRKF